MAGASEIFDLAADFGKAAGQIGSALYDTFGSEGEAFAEDWKANATATSGSHAAQYPGFITSEVHGGLGGVYVEAGPEARGQGDLGRVLEFGTGPNPPHFDGLQAMGPTEARLERAADATIGYLLP